MRSRLKLRGRWVLVTGASSGLGYEMCHVIARDYGGNVLMAARRYDRLTQLADVLRSEYGVEAIARKTDLSSLEETERLFSIATEGRAIHAAILNAAVTYYGPHLAIPDDVTQGILATNVTSVVCLARRFTQYFIDRQEGGALMLISSMAGFLPVPFQSLYAASKAFVSSFGQSLREEVRGRGISITVLTPGGIRTELINKSGLDRRIRRESFGNMDAGRCARIAVRAMVRRQTVCIPGVLYKLLDGTTRVLPRWLPIQIAAHLYREK
ncbi:MAG: SDR family NAD(P)-dependent oxidoreductase [Planctomycetes bacterium]|nr:SDR family NAD(P)-dependent oxidoreductase [Planctomycetota bacterium]